MSLKKILNYKLFKNKKEDTKSSFNIKELKDDIRDILLDIKNPKNCSSSIIIMKYSISFCKHFGIYL